MPFKTNQPASSLPRLSGFSVLGFSGPDAGAFLQAQTMNDVSGLSTGQWQWNGWLNAKGRVIALFALLKLGDQEFVAVLPDFPAQELIPLLQRFVFRSKVRLQEVTDLVPAADLAPPADDGSTSPNELMGGRESGLRMNFSGADLRRHLLLLPETSPALAPADADCDAKWLVADLAHGVPRLVPSQRESWTPQMLSLERLHFFSLKKGCYPGQEIVARTHYLGQARRGLSRVVGPRLALGAELKDDHGVPFGSVICVAADAGSGLAVVRLEKRSASAWIDDQAVALPAFREGLQRPL